MGRIGLLKRRPFFSKVLTVSRYASGFSGLYLTQVLRFWIGVLLLVVFIFWSDCFMESSCRWRFDETVVVDICLVQLVILHLVLSLPCTKFTVKSAGPRDSLLEEATLSAEFWK
ncbi:hypothetical protein AKJ16_DCAP07771 [Drosera capensis]